MPKQRVLKNRNDEPEQPQQQEQHVGKGQQQLRSTNELQQQPPKKITQTVKKGPPKEYRYLKTVKSSEELDEFRFQNYCCYNDQNRKHTFATTITIPCTRKMHRKDCDFELKAFRSSDDGNIIHVYAFAEHNHTFDITNVQRLNCVAEKELAPDHNPPSIFRTPDNIQWTFLQTLPDYDKMQEFRRKNNCQCSGKTNDRSSRIRCCCHRKWNDEKCKFMLLAVKTTKRRFHVYSYGEHNHSVPALQEMQKFAHGKQKSQQEQIEDADEEEVPMEMEEEQEDEPIEREQHAEDIAQTEQDEQMSTEEEEYSKKCQRRLQSNLHKYDMVRTKKWMRRIDQAEIGRIIAEMDIRNVANLMSMADTDIGIFEETLPFWLPWMKKAIRKRRSELVEFVMEFKELLKVESLPDKLKGKIRKMLDKRRMEIEAQKMVPEETTSDEEN